MTTVDMSEIPTFRQLLALKLSKLAAERKRSPTTKGQALDLRPLALLYAIVRVVLHLSGFAALTYAGFQWNTAAGFVIMGLSCFTLSTLLTRRTDSDG